jgi:AbrB family looped-hinge helix DNA binding protein
METIVTIKGQITLPADLRRKYGIKARTRIHIEVDEKANRIILTPITPEYIHSLRGSLKGRGALKVLEAERQREKNF